MGMVLLSTPAKEPATAMSLCINHLSAPDVTVLVGGLDWLVTSVDRTSDRIGRQARRLP